MKPATRQKVNIVIDIILLIATTFLVVIGFVIRYILIPGSERWEKYGRNVDLTILGMDRHQWGMVHLIVGLLFTGLLVLHLILHWKQIIILIKKLLPVSLVRYSVMTFVLGIVLISSVMPFFVSVQVGDSIQRQGRGLARNSIYREHPSLENIVESNLQNSDPTELETVKNTQVQEIAEPESVPVKVEHSSDEHILDIRGYNTIGELSKKYNVSGDSLKIYLGLPLSVSNNERLGRIRRTYNFTMGDVEESVLKLQKK